MFLCGFSYHACYVLFPSRPTQCGYANIWWQSRSSSSSSSPAWRLNKWLKACRCMEVSQCEPLYIALYLSRVVHSCCSCISHSTVFFSHLWQSAPTADGNLFLRIVLLFQALLLFCSLCVFFFFSTIILHIPMCHMLIVSDPHHMALCKELVTVIVLLVSLCSWYWGWH